LQALVQISAAFHHLVRGNRAGAISLLARALRRLDRSPAEFCGLSVATIRDQSRQWLQVLESPNTDFPETFPTFEILA